MPLAALAPAPPATAAAATIAFVAGVARLGARNEGLELSVATAALGASLLGDSLLRNRDRKSTLLNTTHRTR